MSLQPVVYVVDDDVALCEALQELLEAHGFSVVVRNSAEEYLAAHTGTEPGCLLLDVRMPGLSGLDLQTRLSREGATIPIIMLTGHGDVPMAVRALQSGALDFLEKPVNDQHLLNRIRAALDRDAARRRVETAHAEVAQRLACLTPREQEVLEAVISGHPNKQIAADLGITEKTVEVHRKHVMDKTGANNVAELVAMVLSYRNRADHHPG